MFSLTSAKRLHCHLKHSNQYRKCAKEIYMYTYSSWQSGGWRELDLDEFDKVVTPNVCSYFTAIESMTSLFLSQHMHCPSSSTVVDWRYQSLSTHTTLSFCLTLCLQMPISAEQWRVSVGQGNASRSLRPRVTSQSKRKLTPWDILVFFFTALLGAVLFPSMVRCTYTQEHL